MYRLTMICDITGRLDDIHIFDCVKEACRVARELVMSGSYTFFELTPVES